MADTWTTVNESPLYDEHLLLGGMYDRDDSLLAAPIRYGSGHESASLAGGCGLADLAGMTMLLVRGETSPAFVRASCAHHMPAVGECSFGAIVTGDGQVSALPLLARTGDAEYLVADPTERGLALMPWLGFLANIEQQGFRPFEGVAVEDVSDALHPLLLWGPQATAVLGDYVPKLDLLPQPGHVADVALDRIPCVVAAPSVGEDPCYLLLVPPARARILWRSLLSFAAVEPVGTQALVRHGSTLLPWLEELLSEGPVALAYPQLLGLSLVRPEGGFVGERALRS